MPRECGRFLGLNYKARPSSVPLPLSKYVNSKAYEDTKVLLDLFLKVFRTENGEILKYLESGLNVPVDCTELKAYVLSGTVDEFIEQYNELLSHHDEIVEMQK